MSAAHKVVDPYPQAREKMNALCSAMIEAAEFLQHVDLTPQQRRELAGMVAARAKEFGQMAERLSHGE